METLKKSEDQVIVDFIIADFRTKTILIQQRSGSRELFPYCWEFLGGHLEPDETIEECIKRELLEEGNMRLLKIITKLHEFHWSFNTKLVKDIIYMIEAEGDFRLEPGKAIDFKWITRNEASLILRQGQTTNGLYVAAHKAFDIMDKLQKNLAGKTVASK